MASPSTEAEAKQLTVALAGNPNSGKTSVFNQLTGAHQHVGNWPGVTVERKEGTCHFDGRRARVVDLPGTYSLTANSPDERVARDFVLHGGSDVVIAVVDAGNLERNLYLVAQLIELGAPLVVALNMCDIAEGRGFAINVDKLSELLDVPVVPTCANVGDGITELWRTAEQVAQTERRPRPLPYGRQVDEAIDSRTRMSGTPIDASGAYLTTLTYTEGTRTVTIAPTGASFDVYGDGKRYTFAGPQSIAHGAGPGAAPAAEGELALARSTPAPADRTTAASRRCLLRLSAAVLTRSRAHLDGA